MPCGFEEDTRYRQFEISGSENTVAFFYEAAQEAAAVFRGHGIDGGLGGGGDWVEAAAEGFAAFTVAR